MLCLLETLRLIEKLDDEDTSQDSHRSALEATCLANAALSSAYKHDVLRCNKAAAAHKRGWTHDHTFSGGVFYLYAAALFRGLRSTRSTAFERSQLNFGAFLLSEIPETKASSLPMKETYLSTMSLFSYDLAYKKRTSAARAKACAERFSSASNKHFGLEEAAVTPGRALKRSLRPSSQRDSCQLPKHASTRPSWLDPGLAPTAPPLIKTRSVLLNKSCRSVSIVAKSVHIRGSCVLSCAVQWAYGRKPHSVLRTADRRAHAS